MYVVKKPLNIGGRRRMVGEILQDNEVTNAAILRSGMVAKIDSSFLDPAGGTYNSHAMETEKEKVFVPLSGKDPAEGISLSPKEVFMVFWVLQVSAADKAAAEVKECTSRNVLTMIAKTDNRKAVRSAALARLEELGSEEEEPSEGHEKGTNEGDA